MNKWKKFAILTATIFVISVFTANVSAVKIDDNSSQRSLEPRGYNWSSDPNGGETVSGTYTVTLTADYNGNALYQAKVKVYKGTTALTSYMTMTKVSKKVWRFSWDTTGLDDGSNYKLRFKIWRSSGYYTTRYTGYFSIDNSAVKDLVPGGTVHSSLSSVGAEEVWKLEVGSGYTALRGVLTCGSADFDLYFRRGAPPTTSTYDLRGYTSGGEDITYNNPQAGTWYIMVKSYSGTGNYDLTCYLSQPSNVLTSGVTAHSSLASVGAEEMWTIEVGSGFSALRGVLTCGTADFDLYFRRGAPPTTSTYDLRGYTSGGEDITFNNPQAGTWYVMVKSYSGTGNYDLTCTLVQGQGSWGSGGKYAIVVGISDYQYINDLSFCDEDATDWTNFLESRGYEVHVYGDNHPNNYPSNYLGLATEANVRAAIQELANHAQSGDEVLFVTSGHGNGDGHGSSYLCMYDNTGSQGSYYDTEIASDFSGFNTGVNIMVFIDHCFSGGIGPELMSLSQKIYCTTTCTEDGYGYDDPDHHNGAWTYEFLERYWVNSPTSSAESIYDQASATYPHTGGDACMEFDGFTGSFYL